MRVSRGSQVRRRREAANIRKGIEVAQAEVERLPAAHRKPGHRAMFAVGIQGIVRFDERNDVLNQVALEVLSPAVTGDGGWVATSIRTAAPTRPSASARGIGRGVAVGEDDDHGFGLFVGNQVVDHDIRRPVPRPLPIFIAADAVQQEQNGIFLFSGVAGRSVHLHPPFNADGFGVVINPLKCALGGAFAPFVKALRRSREGRFVVRAERDGAAKSAASAASAPAGSGGGLSRAGVAVQFQNRDGIRREFARESWRSSPVHFFRARNNLLAGCSGLNWCRPGCRPPKITASPLDSIFERAADLNFHRLRRAEAFTTFR